MPRAAGDVAIPHQARHRPATATVPLSIAVPEREAPPAGTASSPAPPAVAPSAATRCRVGTSSGVTRRAAIAVPGRRQIRHQDAPRHPVDRKMMDHQQQPSRRCRPASNHTACSITPGRRRKPASAAAPLDRCGRCSAAASSPPTSTRGRQQAGRDRPGRHDLQAPVAGPLPAHQPQPQRIVMIQHRLQRRLSCSRRRPCGQPQQHRLVKLLDRPAALHAASA